MTALLESLFWVVVLYAVCFALWVLVYWWEGGFDHSDDDDDRLNYS